MEAGKVKWFVIVNPVAGGGRGLDHFPQISRYLRDAQILCEPVFTEHKFHATELTVTAVNEGYRHIIVVGGDGTLHEVVNGLFIQQKVCPDEVLLAVVAVGTGNDWVRTFGISNRYQDAVKAISEGYSFLQDVGVVSYEESHYRQSRYMANVAGAGFDAHVVRKFSHLKKKGRKNRWIYTWCLVRQFFRYKSTGMKVWVDDRLVYNNLLLSIAIGICKYNGGGMQQLPEAVADDGMLDVSLIRPVHFWHLLFRFHYLFNGGIYRIRHILQERGSRIRIESSPEISVEVDGELLGETPLEFSILHKAIRIVVSKEFYDKRPETSCSCTVPEVALVTPPEWRGKDNRAGFFEKIPPGCVWSCDASVDALDDIDFGNHPFEKVVGALPLQLAQLRHVGRIGQDGVEELRHRVVGVVHLPGEAVVKSLLLVVVEARGEHALRYEVVVGEDMPHVACVGVQFVHDGRDDHHVDRVGYARHLHEGRVDGIGAFQLPGHLVGEEYELGIGQVVEVNHLAVAAQRFAHGLALFVVPLPLLRAAYEACREHREQGYTEENFFHRFLDFGFTYGRNAIRVPKISYLYPKISLLWMSWLFATTACRCP